jgi:spore coat polysaccharide biosynthesis protein SpsF
VSKLSPDQRERAVAFVVARLSSSRLEAKHLQQIGERRLIEWIFYQLNNVQDVDQVVIATVDEPASEPLKQLAEEHGLHCFCYQGDVDHVTTRLRTAAEKYDADICLLISGDCPLIHGPAIDILLQQFRQNQDADYMVTEPNRSGEHPVSEGVGIFRRRAWQRGDDLSDRPELKEHQFPIIFQRPDLFQAATCHLGDQYCFPHHRFSVDTQADFEFMRRLHRELTEKGQPFALPDALRLLRCSPELLKINQHVHQRQLVEDVKQVLCVIDSGGPYGYGHLMRSLELADQITERLSWPVTFMTDDSHAQQILEQRGLRYHHGALGRPTTAGRAEDKLADYDICLLDLAARPLTDVWRTQLPQQARLVAIDSFAEWTSLADLVVIPGVTAAELDEYAEQRTVIKGADYIILRRAIRDALPLSEAKEIDVLCYAHQPERKQVIEALCERHGWSCRVVDGQVEEFPQLLAAARVFVSNFGYSFYEALALGASPVAWPLSEQHSADARLFYRRLQLQAAVVDNEQEFEDKLEAALSRIDTLPQLDDGTPRIVAALAKLVAESKVES